MGGLSNALLLADVMHARYHPVKNAFNYKVYYVCTALSALPLLGKLALFSLNRFNLFSLHDASYGMGEKRDMQSWIRSVLEEYDITSADGEVVLLTMPRLLGYAFNPVSFWFCLDKQGQLRAVLSEVNNTDGDRHCYISYHDDQRPITQDDWLESNKVFYVSPFFEVEGHYRFRFAYGEEKLGVWINYFKGEQQIFASSVTGKRETLNTKRLLYYFVRYPLVTLKVVALIHMQALKLMAKGMKYIDHPPPPKEDITR